MASSAPPQPSPQQLADQIIEIYSGLMRQTAALMQRLPADQQQAAFDTLRATAEDQLIQLGLNIRCLNQSQQSRIASQVNLYQLRMNSEPQLKQLFEDYWQAIQPVQQRDRLFFTELYAVNIITQYAFFDLLQAQEPEIFALEVLPLIEAMPCQ